MGVGSVGSGSYHEIFYNDHTPMLLINPDKGQILDANFAAVNFYGYRLEELTNMCIHEINVLAEDIVDEQMNLARNKEKSHFIFKHRLANGHICDVDVYSGLINFENKEVIYTIVHDRTDQNKALTKLQDNEELFSLIFEQSPMGACIMSLNFTTLNVNKILAL